MRNKLDFLYYRFYRFQVSVGNGNVAIAFSLLFMSFLVMINFFTIISILCIIVNFDVSFFNPVYVGLSSIFFIVGINYSLFIKNKRYKLIIKTHKNESKNDV